MEDLNPAWPESGEDESGIFFNYHEVEFDVPDPEHSIAWIREAIAEEGFELSRLDFIFCSDEFLLELNRTHLGHDYYTDIITFPLNDNPLLAEIYISIDRVRSNADGLQIPFEDELQRVMIHGVLHLCGYDDHTEDDIQIMRQKEDEYIRKLRLE